MLLADNLRAVIAHSLQEVVVDLDDGAIRFELDDRLRLIDGAQPIVVMQGDDLGLGDIRGDLQNADHPAARIDGIVGRLDPDIFASLALATELATLETARCKLRPEPLVIRRLADGVLAEDAVMLADDLVETVAERFQKVLIGIQDRAIWRKPDHGLGR